MTFIKIECACENYLHFFARKMYSRADLNDIKIGTSCSLNTLLTKLFVAFTKIVHHAFYHLHSRRLIEVNNLRKNGVKVVSTFGQNKRLLPKSCINFSC